MVTQDHQEAKGLLENLVYPDLRVMEETKEKMVYKGQEDYQDQLEMLEREVQEESWDNLDPKAQLENLVPLVAEECLVRMVHREQQDLWGQKENLETLEDLVHPVCKVLEDLQEDEVQEELQVPWENQETMDRMEKLENQDFKVFLEGLAQWELLVIRDLLEIRVPKDLLEYPDHQELGVTQAKMDVQVEVDHQDKLDQQEKEVYQEVLDQEVSKECLVLLERMAWLGKMERLVCKDHLV